jgi:hypothetical protein
MVVTFSLTLNDPGDSTSAYNALYADLTQAASDWPRYLNSNASIGVQVDVGGVPDDAGLVIQNDENDFVLIGTAASGDTGLPVESYLECDDRRLLDNSGSVIGLHP